MNDPNPQPPAAGDALTPGRPGEEERRWAMFAHLSILLGGLVSTGWAGGIGYFVGPLIIWMLKRETMPFVADVHDAIAHRWRRLEEYVGSAVVPLADQGCSASFTWSMTSRLICCAATCASAEDLVASILFCSMPSRFANCSTLTREMRSVSTGTRPSFANCSSASS